MRNLRKIGKSFRYTVLFIVIINILFIGGVWIYSTYNYFNEESEKIKQEYTLREKMRVKDAVNQVIERIEYHKSETEKILDKRIKERAYEAHDMAVVIYEKYKGDKSDEEIEKLIKETLEVIRFNDGRGYYFGGNINKGKLLFTSNPDYVGEMVLDYRGADGRYIFREMVDLVKEKGEGFYEYMWAKPGDTGYDHRKKSFLKLFKPLNLWIGTGAYFKDVEEDIKKDILNEITHRSPDNGKYIFVLDFSGKLLATEDIDQKKDIGENLWELKDDNDIKIVQELKKISVKPQGGFLNYNWIKPGDENKEVPKMTFVRAVDGWEWMVGTGVYLDDIDKTISTNKKILMDQMKEILMEISLFIFLMGGIIFLSEFYVMKKVKRFIDESETIYETLINLSLDGIYLGNEKGEIEDCNISAYKMLGYTREELDTLSLYDFQKNNLDDLSAPKDIITGDSYEERIFKKKNGKFIFIELNSKYVKLNNKKMLIAFVRDITNRKKMEKRLIELSITDGLTGLSNRRHLLNQLEVKLKEVNAEKPLCISMIDIDHFKKINDTLGHCAGDEVLKEFARILTGNLRKTDLIGRYGGEEFLIVLPDTSLEEAEKLMEKIRLKVYNSSWKYPELRVSFSGGLSEVNDPKNMSLENIVIKVDELLYKAKEGGRNKIEVS
ncbi:MULTISPECIES: cache domain-containing protein [Psychrilyobacter]|uniref:Diguanylate cyclase n=1 Tax=Psychrilyobacter piezotolerans TaxID=2293438 RepID=A0ABX9KHY3_9FUSO|nr:MULTISPECIES: cache domain-containing protein [Psychrilyobacter]MCS5421346.1 cache domain-containing protein [Psychrilyobacter sp. S5]NDI77514.1 diguanylate cyclase [Psychrilyobacter piezotolerans]RDE62973.1 diguanylate cyclase [Psychrilyobacter sp. S5]REI41731.1 diguanylate cyclase [Psychrilyobacter piezotolerans]